MKYAFTLINEKLKLYNRISWIVIFIHYVIYIYLSFFSPDPFLRTNGLAGFILFTFLLALRYFMKSKWKPSFDLFFLVMGIGWISMQLYWVAIIPAIFYILNGASTGKKQVIFSDDQVTYPSFPVKKIEWNELSNVILKDGLLTIDFKKNTIIQQKIAEQTKPTDEKDFNEFCKQQLTRQK